MIVDIDIAHTLDEHRAAVYKFGWTRYVLAMLELPAFMMHECFHIISSLPFLFTSYYSYESLDFHFFSRKCIRHDITYIIQFKFISHYYWISKLTVSAPKWMGIPTALLFTASAYHYSVPLGIVVNLYFLMFPIAYTLSEVDKETLKQLNREEKEQNETKEKV